MTIDFRWLALGLVSILTPSVLATWTMAQQKPSTTITAAEAMALLGKMTRIPSGQEFFKGATYVGSSACNECHSGENAEWAKTWHSKMLRPPSKDIIVGDFNNRTITFKNQAATDINDSKKTGTVEFDVVTTEKNGKFFFTIKDKTNPADSSNDQTYEIALVIGGKWEQSYHVKIGDFYYPAPIRWSLAAKDWATSIFQPQDWVWFRGTPFGLPRKPDQLRKPRFAEAYCMGCHTTGFEFVPAANPDADHWKMQGSGELGIGCERCHGPGSKHVAEARAKPAGQPLGPTTIVHGLKDLSSVQQTQMCGQCHARMMGNVHPEVAFPDKPMPSASADDRGFLPGDFNLPSRARFWSYGGSPTSAESATFWPNEWGKRSRQQWQDFTKSAHLMQAGMSCLTCHAFHGKWDEYQLRPLSTDSSDPGSRDFCAGCHNASGQAKRPNWEMYENSPHAKAGVRCVDCHMSPLGQRLGATGTGATKPPPWDVSSHVALVATPRFKHEYDPDDKIKLRTSCDHCHVDQKLMPDGTKPSKKGLAEFDAETTEIQEEICGKIQEVQSRLDDFKTAAATSASARPGPAEAECGRSRRQPRRARQEHGETTHSAGASHDRRRVCDQRLPQTAIQPES
jgi:hypothetical protein